MKLTSSLLSLLLFISLTACNNGISTLTGNGPMVKGSGNVITESRDATEDFSKLTARGSVNIFLKKGDNQKIDIEAEDNIMPLVIVEIKNGELIARTEGSMSTKKGVNIYITYKDLYSITSSGSTDVKVESNLSGKSISLSSSGSSDLIVDSIDTDNLEVKSSGSSDIIIKQVLTNNLLASLSGASDVRITGKATNLKASTSGSSDLYASDLSATTADLSSSGSSDIKARVSDKLTAKASGSSDIYYRGDPKDVAESKSGSASILKR